jgi:hypothetical protein
MHHPLPIPHGKGVILRDLQIIHHLHARNNRPVGNEANAAIGSHHMHAHRDLLDRQEAVLSRQEGVLVVGLHHLTLRVGSAAMVRLCCRGDGQVHQVVVGMDPDMHDGLHLHLVRLEVIISPALLTDMSCVNGPFPLVGCYSRRRDTTSVLILPGTLES